MNWQIKGLLRNTIVGSSKVIDFSKITLVATIVIGALRVLGGKR